MGRGDGKGNWLKQPMASKGKQLPKDEERDFQKCFSPIKSQEALQGAPSCRHLEEPRGWDLCRVTPKPFAWGHTRAVGRGKLVLPVVLMLSSVCATSPSRDDACLEAGCGG